MSLMAFKTLVTVGVFSSVSGASWVVHLVEFNIQWWLFLFSVLFCITYYKLCRCPGRYWVFLCCFFLCTCFFCARMVKEARGSAVDGSGCRVYPTPCSWFGFPAHANQAFHPSWVGKLAPYLSGNDKIPSSSSVGHRESLCRPNTHSNCYMTPLKLEMRGASQERLIDAVLCETS